MNETTRKKTTRNHITQKNDKKFECVLVETGWSELLSPPIISAVRAIIDSVPSDWIVGTVRSAAAMACGRGQQHVVEQEMLVSEQDRTIGR